MTDSSRSAPLSEAGPLEPLDDRAAREFALGSILASSLRPICVGLGLFFALLSGWYMYQLDGEARATMVAASGLLALGLVVGAFWFERNTLPPRAANPVAALIGIAVIMNCLLLLVSVPRPHMTMHLMLAVMGFGCLLLSIRWFALLGGLSIGGFLWIVGARHVDPDWYHFGLGLAEATLFGLLVLYLRIRAYADIQQLRKRDRDLVQRLEAANATAEAAVRTKSDFLANMSHEIRTPMTAMLGMTELLQMTELDADQRDYASTVSRAGENLLSLVNDILDFSKIEAGRLEIETVPFNLRRLLEEIRDLLQVKAQQKHLELAIGYEDNLPTRFRGDPTRLRQILMNLAGNAIKFTSRGGVTLHARGREVQADQWHIELEVIDTGIGIPKAMLDRVFEAFTQADSSTTRQFGGTGLGLAISSELTRLMGGDIDVRSVENKGSTFTVRLLLPLEHAGTMRPDPQPSERVEFQGRVLLVEDNEENQQLAKRMLTTFGCQVAVANDGAEAVARLADEDFDLVFMDCQMRNMNGYEATERIRLAEAEARRTPIIALTANVLPEERERCAAVGMDGYVAKPFSYRDLHQVLVRWL